MRNREAGEVDKEPAVVWRVQLVKHHSALADLVLNRDAITSFFYNHHIHIHTLHTPLSATPFPLPPLSAMPPGSRFHKADAKFNVTTECKLPFFSFKVNAIHL